MRRVAGRAALLAVLLAGSCGPGMASPGEGQVTGRAVVRGYPVGYSAVDAQPPGLNRVVAVPAARTERLWPQTSIGQEPEPGHERPFRVDRSVLEALDARFAVLADGVFALDDVDEGTYLVCLARQEQDEPSMLVQGCDRQRVDVPGRLDIRWVDGSVDVLRGE